MSYAATALKWDCVLTTFRPLITSAPRCGDAGGISVEMPHILAPAEGVPAFLRDLLGKPVTMLRTRGDGACAIHSVYGEERGGEIRKIGPRKFLRDAYGETASEFAERVQDDAVVEELAGVLWKELLKPCVLREVRGGGPVLRESRESKAVWERLRNTSPVVAEEIHDAVATDEALYQSFLQKTDGHRGAIRQRV